MISSLPAWLRIVERGLAMSLLMAIFGLVFTATAFRYAGSPIIWSLEVSQAMFVWLCVLAADVTLQNFGHFSVPAFADMLSPPARRLLEIFNAVVVLGLLAFLFWYGMTFAEMSRGRTLPMIGVSEGIATAALPLASR